MSLSYRALVETQEGLQLRLSHRALNSVAHPDDYLGGVGVCDSCWWAERVDNKEMVLLWRWADGTNWSIHREDLNYARHKAWMTA